MAAKKIAILLSSSQPPQWAAKTLELMAEIEDVEPILLIPEHQGQPPQLQSWGWIHAFYQKLTKRLGRIAADQPSALPTQARDWPLLKCADAKAALDTLARESPEIILDLGCPFLLSSFFQEGLSRPLWHFSHSSGPTHLFWDVLKGKDWTEADLRRRQQGTDEVLHREHFRITPGSYSNTLHRLRYGSSHWPALAVRAALSAETRAAIAPEPPGNADMLRYLVQSAITKIAGRLKPQRRWQEQWAIGLIRQSAESTLRQGLGPVHWLHPPPGCLAADPFLWRQGDEHFVFFELLRHRAGVGEIAFVSTRDFVEFSPVEVVVGAPGRHWSYPFLLQWEGSTYCIPEHCQGNQVTLYKAHEFPRHWRPEAILLENFPGVDPSVFFHGGRFWMLVADTTSAYDCLYAFHATALTGPWEPHLANPIVRSHAHLGRPGGRIFFCNGKLYRPAQMGHRYYGFGILLYEIQELTTETYSESPVRVLLPDPASAYPDGIHHLDSLDQWTVIDSKLHAVDGGAKARRQRGTQLRLRTGL